MADPNLPVLVYDGDCGFCTQSARWVERHLGRPSEVAVEPWQALDLDALGLTTSEVTDAAWYVDEQGRRHRGHHAAAAVLGRIGGGWAAVGRLLTLPVISSLAAVGYTLVARNRGRLPGATDACRLPPRP